MYYNLKKKRILPFYFFCRTLLTVTPYQTWSSLVEASPFWIMEIFEKIISELRERERERMQLQHDNKATTTSAGRISFFLSSRVPLKFLFEKHTHIYIVHKANPRKDMGYTAHRLQSVVITDQTSETDRLARITGSVRDSECRTLKMKRCCPSVCNPAFIVRQTYCRK